jgi:hypothetical protein
MKRKIPLYNVVAVAYGLARATSTEGVPTVRLKEGKE